MTDRPTIAIIGASFTGLPIAHGLLSHFHKPSSTHQIRLILINPSPLFYWAIAAPRILSKPSAFTESQYLLPIAEGFSAYSSDEFEFVLGTATSVDFSSKTIIVESSSDHHPTTRDINYDYLVIASGSSTPATLGLASNPNPNPNNKPTNDNENENGIYPFKSLPTSTPAIQSAITSAQSTIANASSIVIAGAGPIGIETAGELGDLISTRNLTVTLVSATDRLLPTLKPSAGAAAESLLTSLGVRIVKGRKVVAATSSSSSTTKTVVKLDNGDTLDTDIYIPTTGVVPNSSFLPQEILTPTGWVQVTPELQIQGFEDKNVYAAGDITHHKQKLALKVAEMVPVVIGNLIDDITPTSSSSSTKNGNSHCGSTKRKTYIEGEGVSMAVPVGETGGTGQFFGWVPWSFLVRVIKGRDFFVGKARGVVFP
ncbi:FAD/NAD(P)-binding domain-containing protein [Aspergillus sclerotiicarbonarius CBS 121057]|uniref:FAD/NAD(P)-binding domain-containing protein n=1 Tax=Aspergillus sclerotiicarbonarius (strain CBS 121057 / IBT 28362) TaxID=1448318 RepID=A0A319EP07_ASPSB|nr:FAD/NAD(P)-binding domain-containing protein [Aspergillus sclerotiicarbonarius CBS 121057]